LVTLKSRSYKIQEALIQPSRIESSRAVWDGEHVSISADEAINSKKGRDAPDRDDAEEFLKQFLANGPKKQEQVGDAAKGHLHSWRTVRRAAQKLKIKPKKDGMDGPWMWELPE
jgi:hypothetical protein